MLFLAIVISELMPDPLDNCAKMYLGAFWYNVCHRVNPTGKYYNQPEATNGKIKYGTGAFWYCFRSHSYSMKKFSWQILVN